MGRILSNHNTLSCNDGRPGYSKALGSQLLTPGLLDSLLRGIGGIPALGKKRVFVETTRFHRTRCPRFPWRPCPGRRPPGASPTGLYTGRRCAREVPRQPRNRLDGSGTTITRARGQRRMRSPSPARRLAPPASAAGPHSLPSAAPAGRAPRGTRDLPAAPPSPRPGPREAALPVNSLPRPAPSPPPPRPRGPLSGARLARPRHHSAAAAPPPFPTAREPGRGVSARGAAAEGSVRHGALPVARGSAHELAERRSGRRAAGLRRLGSTGSWSRSKMRRGRT